MVQNCYKYPDTVATFPNVQPKSPLAQLEAIPSDPITSHMREEADPQLTTTSLQLAIESNKDLWIEIKTTLKKTQKENNNNKQ